MKESGEDTSSGCMQPVVELIAWKAEYELNSAPLIHNKKKSGKYTNIMKLNNQHIKEETTKEIIK